jgi:hypothetical protein
VTLSERIAHGPTPPQMPQDTRCSLDDLRALSEALDRAFQSALPATSVAEPVWQERNDQWVPLSVFDDVTRGLPCPMRSSLTDEPCVLTWSHPADSATRFHRFTTPAVPFKTCDEPTRSGAPCARPAGHGWPYHRYVREALARAGGT